MYRIVFTENAQKDLQMLQKKAPQAIKKLKSLHRLNKQGTPFGVSYS